MRRNRQLFYTFKKVMLQIIDKKKCGTKIFTNIEKIEFKLDDEFVSTEMKIIYF